MGEETLTREQCAPFHLAAPKQIKMKKLPPYGRRLVIPRQTKIVMLYIGAPHCWQAAKQDQLFGLVNHLVLPDISEVSQYKWPLDDCCVVVIDFGISGQTEIENLIISLVEANAAEISVRQINSDRIVVYVREEQETSI